MLENFHTLFHSIYYNILPFVGVLSTLVFVHELGHYLVAKHNGVYIEAFSIGFGPEICGWTDQAGTRWKICCIPLGGYVKMFSDLNAASQPDYETVSQMSEIDKQKSLFHKTVGQRIAVSIAGPAANYLFAIILMTGFYIFSGQRVPTEQARLGFIAKDSAASKAGLQVNDVITQIDGKIIAKFIDLQAIVKNSADRDLKIQVERQGQLYQFNIKPKPQIEGGKTIGLIGVMPGVDYHKLSFYTAPKQAVLDVMSISWQSLTAIGHMITGQQSADGLSGPLGIANLTSMAAKQGFADLVWLSIILSISLGLLNLMPVPMLDGGHILFYVIEAVRGKPVSERVQDIGYKIGLAMVLCLVLYSTWNDLSHFQFVKNFFDACGIKLG